MESTMNRRAYANLIDPLRVLDIRDEPDSGGRMRVTYLRMRVSTVVRDGDFKTATEDVIWEIERNIGEEVGTKKEWRYNSKDRTWSSEESGYNPGGEGIPFFTLYTNQTGHYEAEPALEDLAWVNLAHYQSRADHAHVMRVARLITLVLTGWKKHSARDPNAKGSEQITLGPLSKLENSDPNAKAYFLEPSGRSIELSFQDLDTLAKEASRLGARYLSSGKSHVTAQSVILDHAKHSNDLYSFCVRMESELQNVFEAVGVWLNTDASSVDVTINKEFDTNPDFDGAAKAIQAISDVLSPKQKILESIRHGILRPSFPVDENLSELEEIQEVMRDAFGEGVIGDESGNSRIEDEPEDE